mmetsp:Transcript_28535/g.42598  ORF Transcript_28535/g.42598 Transcript_28535/m.42598 type:complete len:677 (+) Transcript_28535:37-2067(+)
MGKLRSIVDIIFKCYHLVGEKDVASSDYSANNQHQPRSSFRSTVIIINQRNSKHSDNNNEDDNSISSMNQNNDATGGGSSAFEEITRSNPDIPDELLTQTLRHYQEEHPSLPVGVIGACHFPIIGKKMTSLKVRQLVGSVAFRSDGKAQIASRRNSPAGTGTNQQFFIMPTSPSLDEYMVFKLPLQRRSMGLIDPTRGFKYKDSSYATAYQSIHFARCQANFLTKYYRARYIDDGTGTRLLDLTDTHDFSSGSSYEENGWVYRWNCLPRNTSVEEMLEVRKRLLFIEVEKSVDDVKSMRENARRRMSRPQVSREGQQLEVHDGGRWGVERPLALNPPPSPSTNRDGRDRVARVAADRDDRDRDRDRNQDNLNMIANLIRQQLSTQNETNDTLRKADDTFRQEMVSFREDQQDQQRQINDVNNRQVEDRQMIDCLNEDVISLRGKFDDMVERMERAGGDVKNPEEEGSKQDDPGAEESKQENPKPDVSFVAEPAKGWTKSEAEHFPSLTRMFPEPGKDGYVGVEESFINGRKLVLGLDFSAHPHPTIETLLKSFGASKVYKTFYDMGNISLLLASPNDTKRITKAEQNGIEVITALKDFLDRLKKPEEGRQETHSFVGDAEDKDPTPSSATFVDADEDYRRHLEEQRYCKQCIDHVLAQEGAQPPWVNRGCPMCGPR